MRISEVMSRHVTIARPDDTLRDAARAMAEIDSGALPVGENNRLVGMITDRDIAVRAVAEGLDGATTTVREVMTDDVKYCFEDESVDHVADNMASLQMRRLPVVDRDKRLVGIVSLADIATQEKPAVGGHALRGISQPDSQGDGQMKTLGSKRAR
jgi:CBS domain-containing protein